MFPLSQLFARLRRFYVRDIWQPEALNNTSARGRLMAAMRVASVSWSGISDNKLATKAGALSFSSMLGLGPLVALVVLVSSVLLQRNDPDFAVNQLNRAIKFIAPQLSQLATKTETSTKPGLDQAVVEGDVPADALPVDPELVNLLNTIIEGSQSKAIGIAGILALILIVIQLFSSIENAFNQIWGVKRGRNWLLRIAFYWGAATLGAVLALGSLALMSASTFVTMIESLPMGSEIRQLFIWAGPLISMIVLMGLLTGFYKFIPNTDVGLWPSVTGAITVVIMLYLNNLMAFLYLRNVTLNQSLFGALGVLPVLMFGLYVFWLIVLLGGQITYATQNANYRISHLAWYELNIASRRGLALLILTLISRRFRDCRSAYNARQLAEIVKIPTQILNACLRRLTNLGLISPIPSSDEQATNDHRFQPARPLNKVTLTQFKNLFETSGEGPSRDILDSLDPVVREFNAKLDNSTTEALGEETLEAAIERLAPVSQPTAGRPGGAGLSQPGSSSSDEFEI